MIDDTVRFDTELRPCAVCEKDTTQRRRPGTITPGGQPYPWRCENADNHIALLEQRAREQAIEEDVRAVISQD